MKKSDELLQQLKEIKNAMKVLKEEGKIEDSFKKLEEIKNLEKEIEIEKALEEEEIKAIENKGVVTTMENSANSLRAIIKDMNRKSPDAIPLTDAETKIINAVKTVTTKNGMAHEEYILPQDISTQIKNKVESSKCFKNYLGLITTNSLSGAFPIDATPDIELTDFVDGTAMEDSNNLDFKQITFRLHEKGAIISLNNTVLNFSDNDLNNHVVKVFAKRAIKTFNRMGREALELGKTVKTFTDIKSLVKSLQVDIDPDMLTSEAVIITNQDGFQKLTEKDDLRGVSYVQPDLTKPAILTINGVKVEVFSNGQLPSKMESTKKFAPIYAGNLVEGASFVDAGKYQFATDASSGFRSNVTDCRILDYVDCIQVYGEDTTYVVGKLEV